MSFVKCRRVVLGLLSVSAVTLTSTALGGASVAAAPGHSRSSTGGNSLSFVGTTSPDQARGRFNLPGSHKPFFAHGGKSQPPNPSPVTASAVSVAGLSVPGPTGSASGITASATDVLDSLNTQVTDLGSDQSLEPPDNGLATGNGYVVELLNDSGWIWQSSGGALVNPYPGNPFDLNKFFYVPSGYSASDPRIVYDPVGQVWIASAVAFSATGSSYLDIDVSSTSNPEGGWKLYDLQGASDLYDQPKLGVSGNQIVVSANDFLAGQFFEGAITWVFDRAGVETGTFLTSSVFGPDSAEFSVVPASVVSGSVEYAVWNDADCSYSGCSTGSPTLGVIEIAGSPKTNNVTAAIYNPSISATSNPPTATQPAPGSPLNTDDDRYLGAIWLPSGIIWTGGNDACTPPGDTTARPCMRLDEISVSGTPTVLQDFDAGAKGAALMYPAVAVDSSGDLGVVYSASSSTEPVSVGTAGQAAGAPADSLSTGPWLETGSGSYVDGTSEPRWGDYSGASAMGTGIWVAGEYSGQSGTADWAVAGAFLTFGGGGGGPTPNTIVVSASPSQLTAGSGAKSNVMATVSNNSVPVNGDSVSFSTSGTCGPLSAASAVTSSGVASVSYTAATSPGKCTITATDSSGGIGSTSVTQVSNTIVVKANPTQLIAGSGSTSQVTATVTNNSNAVNGDTVHFKTTGTCGSLSASSAVTSSGMASVNYTASRSTGTCTITATDSSGGTGSTSVSQVKRHR